MNPDHPNNQRAGSAANSRPASRPAYPSLSTARTTTSPYSPGLTSPVTAAHLLSPRQFGSMSHQAFHQGGALNGAVNPTPTAQSVHNSVNNASSRPVGTPAGNYATTPPRYHELNIQGLPADTSQETLSLMLQFLKRDLLTIDMLTNPPGPSTALVRFSTQTAAQRAKDMFDESDSPLRVEILSGSPLGSMAEGYPVHETYLPSTSGPSPTSLNAFSQAPTQRFERDSFATDNAMARIASYTNRGIYGQDLEGDSQQFYSAAQPYYQTGTRVSGKDLIADTTEEDDDQELLSNPLRYAQNEPPPQQRRSTFHDLSLSSRMDGLSMNTNPNGASSLPHYGQQSMTPASYGTHTSSHSGMNGNLMMNGASGPRGHQFQNSPPTRFPQGVSYPAANPADQNPPCNTLYVGNLPMNTNEEELKQMFAKVRGYKRLCFRAKHNGPMCFVEFEDVTAATKALNQYYGVPITANRSKGGIRLSFSKNPLGVRSQQPGKGPLPMNGHMAASANGFPNAPGPPPGLGLAAPPGLHGSIYNGNHGSMYPNGTNSQLSAAYPNSGNNLWDGHIGNARYHTPYTSYQLNSTSTPPNGSMVNAQHAAGHYASLPNDSTSNAQHANGHYLTANAQHANGYYGTSASMNGSHTNGTSTNGVPANGISPIGVSPNGISSNGISSHGMSANGMSANGISSNGNSSNGISTNGRPTNGKQTNSNSTNGVSPNGVPLNSPNGASSSQ